MHMQALLAVCIKMSQKKTAMWWMVVAITVALSVVLQGRCCDGCFEDERLALLQLKDSINISSYSSLFDESTDDCCRWERVQCNPVSGRVMELSLDSLFQAQKWRLNASLFLPFRELTRLNLSGSAITGFVGKLSGLINLEILDLGSNRDLNRSTLSSLSFLPSLKSLVLKGCDLLGGIEDVCQLKHLQELDISSNVLYSELPSCLANLTSLTSLDLSDNYFTGDTMMANSPLIHLLLSGNNFHIPISLSPFLNHSNLLRLEARNNNLTGVYANQEYSLDLVPKFQLQTVDLSSSQSLVLGQPFPKFLYHQKHLQFLDLSHDSFQGGFPSWLLENNTNLVQLILANNSLSGSLQQLPNRPHKRLSSLDISRNALDGKLPWNLGEAFPSLSYANMADNGFMGRIPDSITRLHFLHTLVLSNNRFSGNIPARWDMCSTLYRKATSSNETLDWIQFPCLDRLQLNDNLLSGMIPDSLANQTLLTMLDLGNNNLSGHIPNWVGNLSILEVLDLSQNSLSGKVPKGLFSKSMKEVYLSRNQLEGPLSHLPLTLGFYQRESYSYLLLVLDLSHNHLTGMIPGLIETFSRLSYLLLNNNNFHGPIPTQVCQLENLSLLDLSHNNLSGQILPCIRSSSGWSRSRAINPLVPSRAIGSASPGSRYRLPVSDQPQQSLEFTTKGLSHLYHGTILFYISGIDLSNNSLTGEIPLAFGNFADVNVLNLSHNFLSQSIPTTFSNLKQIESLDLSYNNLNGSIPNKLVDLNFLAIFSVAHNNLSGKTLGKVAQFGTFDESSYLGNDLLCGWPLPKDCPGARVNDGVSETPPRNYEEGDGGGFMNMGAFWVSFSGSYVVMLLGIVTVLWVNPYWRRAWFYCVEVAAISCYYFVVDHLPVPVKYRISHPRCF